MSGPDLAARRRLAVVLATEDARTAAPIGLDASAFAAACLLDSYEVLADLQAVTAGIAGTDTDQRELLWPGDVWLPAGCLFEVAQAAADIADELVIIPAAVPDLPGLVVAKLFKALSRADVSLAPERGRADSWVAIGVTLPWPSWLPADLGFDRAGRAQLLHAAPRRGAVALGPDWHRLRDLGSLRRLDQGLEGWEATRALLSEAK